MIPDPSSLAAEADRVLAQAAMEARSKANPRVSGFRVGACLRSASNNLYGAGNVESPTNLFNLCAERGAMVVAFAAEGPTLQVGDIAVCADAATVSPCGACRQALLEFGVVTRVIYIESGVWVARSIAELLPAGYDGWSAAE